MTPPAEFPYMSSQGIPLTDNPEAQGTGREPSPRPQLGEYYHGYPEV